MIGRVHAKSNVGAFLGNPFGDPEPSSNPFDASAEAPRSSKNPFDAPAKAPRAATNPFDAPAAGANPWDDAPAPVAPAPKKALTLS